MNKDNGGFAFPHPAYHVPSPTGGFGHAVAASDGMTLRDYFAAQAMLPTFMLAMETVKASPRTVKYDERDLAEGAYKFADAMLAERSK